MQHIVEKETEGGVAVDETAGAAAVAAAVVMASPGKAKDTKDISGTLTITLYAPAHTEKKRFIAGLSF